MTGLPTPKYAIGDRVWFARPEGEVAQLDCPDCLNTRKWTMTTPAGQTYEVRCQRCGSRSINNRFSLTYQAFKATAQILTIGSIEARTHGNGYRDGNYVTRPMVKYMAHETGIGSGSQYDEDRLFLTEAEALASVQAEIDEKNAAIKETPDFLTTLEFSNMPIPVVIDRGFNNDVWRAWYHYKNLREQIEALVSEPPPNWPEAIEEIISWEAGYEDFPMLGDLLIAARRFLEVSDLGPLTEAFDAAKTDLRSILEKIGDNATFNARGKEK